MSVTADNLMQFVMQNQDQDPLVKKCFQISTRGVHFWCRKVFEGDPRVQFDSQTQF